MVLPEPVWSDDDTSGLISNAWSKDPTKLAIIRALGSCQARLSYGRASFDAYIIDALAQKEVCFLHSYSLEVEEVH